MYEEFYGFREKPFQLVPNPNYMYKSSKHSKALTYMEYGLRENLGFVLLTGEIGSGKTTLTQYLLDSIENGKEVAVIFNTNVTAGQLLGMILKEFDLNAPSTDKATVLETLNLFLIERHAAGKSALLVIDEAQNLSETALEEVRMLSNLQTENQSLLQIMLVGQPELLATIKRPSLRQFAQRVAVSYHLTGLAKAEVGKYISFRMQKAGGPPDLFTPHAVDEIFKLSNGIPRSINLICQAALVYGFADEASRITQDTVKQIIKDDISIGASNGAPIPPNETLQEIVPGAGNDMDQRLSALERHVQQLQTQAQKQNSQSSQKEVLSLLQQSLQQEQKRNAVLMKNYSRLKTAYVTLQRRLKSTDDHKN